MTMDSTTTPTNHATIKPSTKKEKAAPTPTEPSPASASSTDAPAERKIEYLAAGKDDAPLALINPEDLVMPPFDSRAQAGVIDEGFRNSIKEQGILQPILVTPIKHPETGETSYMIVEGRRRVRVARELKLAEVPCAIKPFEDYQAALLGSVSTNLHKAGLTAFDMATSLLALKNTGLSQTQIKAKIGKTDGFVSQHLSVFDLDPRVIKLVAAGKLEPGTLGKVIQLKRVTDGDQQYALIMDTLKDKDVVWTAADLAAAVEKIKTKEDAAAKAKAERAKKGKAKAKDGDAEPEAEEVVVPEFALSEIDMIKKGDMQSVLEATAAKVAKMKAKDDTDPAKLAYEKGKLDGLKLACGLKELPKGLVTK